MVGRSSVAASAKPGKKNVRSKTGCYTCRVRKVKCDEEKLPVATEEKFQCRRCLVAGLGCEWKGTPARKVSTWFSPRYDLLPVVTSCLPPGETLTTDDRPEEPVRTREHVPLIAPRIPRYTLNSNTDNHLQLANTLELSLCDRKCWEYFQSSDLILIMGKEWRWCTLSYVYQKVAVREPMVMRMILASSASEMHRYLTYEGYLSRGEESAEDLDATAKRHYSEALSDLREILKHDLNTPRQLESVMVTIWFMLFYECRFGQSRSVISVHMRGLMSLLFKNLCPSLELVEFFSEHGWDSMQLNSSRYELFHSLVSKGTEYSDNTLKEGLQSTSFFLFFLWILYFDTPSTLLNVPNLGCTQGDFFRYFLHDEMGLSNLFECRRKCSYKMWGDEYPVDAFSDDLENLQSLQLFHACQVHQFKIAEPLRQSTWLNEKLQCVSGDPVTYRKMAEELVATFKEHENLFTSARNACSDHFTDGRRLMQTMLWATITYYGTVVYFYVCSGERQLAFLDETVFPCLEQAVSRVLNLALKVHKNRPRTMIRIAWPLFMAGIAAQDEVHQDWVSDRLKELRRCGINFSHISDIYNDITNAKVTKRLIGKETTSSFIKNIRKMLEDVKGENFLL